MQEKLDIAIRILIRTKVELHELSVCAEISPKESNGIHLAAPDGDLSTRLRAVVNVS